MWRGAAQHLNINMLLAENPPLMHAAAATTNATAAAAAAAYARPQPAEPTLIDFEAIDLSWRRDIEQEKGVLLDGFPTLAIASSSHATTAAAAAATTAAACSSSLNAAAISCGDISTAEQQQFERDLQLLTQKSLMTMTVSGARVYLKASAFHAKSSSRVLRQKQLANKILRHFAAARVVEPCASFVLIISHIDAVDVRLVWL